MYYPNDTIMKIPTISSNPIGPKTAVCIYIYYICLFSQRSELLFRWVQPQKGRLSLLYFSSTALINLHTQDWVRILCGLRF